MIKVIDSLKRNHKSSGAVLAEAAIALAIFVPIFIVFGALLINAAVSIGDRGASASYAQSPCEVDNTGALVDPITKAPADWCV